MNIIISSKNMDSSQSLNKHIDDSLSRVVRKYFPDAISAHVNVAKDGDTFHTSIIVNEGVVHSIVIKADGSDHDSYKSADKAIHRIETRLRRYKNRIKRHHKSRQDGKELFSVDATEYVIPPIDEEGVDDFGGDKGAIRCEAKARVISKKYIGIQKMTVSDAVMQMDLLNMTSYLFINLEDDRVNIVQYREDGNITLIDTGVCS